MNLSKLEILNETASFYSEDVTRRATGRSDDCVYVKQVEGKEDQYCAFSRCCTPMGRLALQAQCNESMGVIGAMSHLYQAGHVSNPDSADEILEPRYRGHSINFWAEIQDVHDNSRNWNDDGLTEDGTKQVVRFRKKFTEELESHD
jgi:hypothetical protein